MIHVRGWAKLSQNVDEEAGGNPVCCGPRVGREPHVVRQMMHDGTVATQYPVALHAYKIRVLTPM